MGTHVHSSGPKARLFISATGGHVVAVHDDHIVQPLGPRLGDMRITRASEVEWNNGQWEATEIKTGQVIAAGPVRQKVLQDERAVLESKLGDYVA